MEIMLEVAVGVMSMEDKKVADLAFLVKTLLM